MHHAASTAPPLSSRTCRARLGRLGEGEGNGPRPGVDEKGGPAESDSSPDPNSPDVHAIGLRCRLAHCREGGEGAQEGRGVWGRVLEVCMRVRAGGNNACDSLGACSCSWCRAAGAACRLCKQGGGYAGRRASRHPVSGSVSAPVWLLPGCTGSDQRAVSSSLATTARVAQLRGLHQNTLHRREERQPGLIECPPGGAAEGGAPKHRAAGQRAWCIAVGTPGGRCVRQHSAQQPAVVCSEGVCASRKRDQGHAYQVSQSGMACRQGEGRTSCKPSTPQGNVG